MVTGNYTKVYPIHDTNVSGSTTYDSDINYNVQQRIWAQSLNVTFNLMF